MSFPADVSACNVQLTLRTNALNGGIRQGRDLGGATVLAETYDLTGGYQNFGFNIAVVCWELIEGRAGIRRRAGSPPAGPPQGGARAPASVRDHL